MKILKNTEVKLSLGILAVLLLVFGAVCMYMVHSYTRTLNKIHIQQNIAVIGAVVREYPEAEIEIVRNFTGDFQKDYELGQSVTSKYNYDENLSIYKNNSITRGLWLTNIRFLLLIGAFALVLIIFFFLSLNRLYSRIRKISEGAEAVVEGNFQPLEGGREEGDMGFLISQFNLMTQRLSENVQALKDEKLSLKRLITDISHQLKTPLASLIMFNDILKNDLTITEQERTTFIAESKNQLDRIDWLIKNLLKMAKLEAGVVEFKKETAPIHMSLEKSIAGLKYLADEKNIIISVAGDRSICANHDVSWTVEAFSNIIKNCIEHSFNGGNIEINWEENSVFLEVVIGDRGMGIPREELPRIFNRFYKGPNSCNPTNIGIGLYITKNIIEGQGGAVYVSSEHGKGSKFIIRFMKME